MAGWPGVGSDTLAVQSSASVGKGVKACVTYDQEKPHLEGSWDLLENKAKSLVTSASHELVPAPAPMLRPGLLSPFTERGHW